MHRRRRRASGLLASSTVVGFASFAPSAQAAWETRNAGGMSVHVYTPGSESPLGGHGLLVALHGCTQSATQLRDFGNFEHAAEDFGMVVALPDVPGGGVYAGCWNYYGALHNDASGHDAAVISLAETLLADGTLGIDPAQVYVSGFSSGGGEALVVACLAPDLFAGVGATAGPSLGTEATQIGMVAQTAEGAKTLCMQYAGGDAGALDSQLAVMFTDAQDFVVAQGYAAINAEMFASIYASPTTTAFDLAGLEGAMPAGQGTSWADAEGPRVALLQSTSGGGHAWPAGSGQAGGGISYVSGTGVDFAYYLATFFTANNRRADGDWDPGNDDDGGSSGDDGSDADDAADDDDGSDANDEVGDDDDASDSASAGVDDDADDDGPAGDGEGGATDGRIEPSGCQCAAANTGADVTPPSLVIALFAVPWLRRRRRA
jgi:poly(3-hydroxybutyrate) depolymerase